MTLRCLLLTALAVLPLTLGAGRPGEMIADGRRMLAEMDFRGARAAADSVLATSHNDLTRLSALDILSRSYLNLGMLAETDSAYRRAIGIFNAAGTPTSDRDYRNLLFNYSQFLLAAGQYDRSREVIDAAEFPAGSADDLDRRGLLASIETRRGNHLAALDLLNGAIAAADSAGLPAQTLLQNRGYLQTQRRHYGEAFADLMRAMEGLQGTRLEIVRANRAMALSGLGRHDEALADISIALDRLAKLLTTSDPDYLIALRKKGEILAAAGRKAEAADAMRLFFRLERDRLTALLPTLSPRMRLDYWTREKPLLSRCFIIGKADPRLAFDVALMRRQTSLLGAGDTARTLCGLNADSRSVSASLRPDEAAVAFVTFPDANGATQYAAATLTANGRTTFVPLFPESFIYSRKRIGRHSLHAALTSEDPQDKEILYSDSALADSVWQPVLRALPANVRTIHFAPEGVFHLWGIENMPFSGAERYDLVRHFSLLDINPTEAKQKCDSALIAGGLDYNAVAEAETSPLPNSDALTELRRSYPEGFHGAIFTYLPGTAAEAAAIGFLTPGSTPRTVLTEEVFKADAGKFSEIHLATHGYALDCGIALSADPAPGDSLGFDLTLLRSGLALSGANTVGDLPGRDDGIISAREICDLDLRGVDLVTLSACQTAKGLITDESASGLIRALKTAGVKTIVATLWEVDDRCAAFFMKEFYGGLRAGLSRREAFSRARDLTASHTVSRPLRRFSPAAMASRPTDATIDSQPFASPWFWAPFILIDP